jgi:hypothetical protein
MPYPLAHPAAILPLRRYCKRWLDFPSLIIGSLSPDLGYASGPLQLFTWSHTFWTGSFLFCLPVGIVLVALFYLLRSLAFPSAARMLRLSFPKRFRPPGSPVAVIASLLVGTWTHILLDSLTHEDGWLVEHLPWLRLSLPSPIGHNIGVYDLLYALCTFGGVFWLAFSYLQWCEGGNCTMKSLSCRAKRFFSITLAVSILAVSELSREPRQVLPAVPAVLLALLLVIGFLVATNRTRTRSKRNL